MPHLILEGEVDLESVFAGIPSGVHRWRTAVLKTENAWFRSDGLAVLVEGVVVEHSRAVHPVALIATARGTTSIRLWPLAPVERTPAVQRWLAVLACDIRRQEGFPLRTTNVAEEILSGLEISA